MPQVLEYDESVAEATEHIYPKLRLSVPRFEWEIAAPLIAEINRLKRERNAIILGHNYMVPEIFHGISDFTGDSLALAREARASAVGCRCATEHTGRARRRDSQADRSTRST